MEDLIVAVLMGSYLIFYNFIWSLYVIIIIFDYCFVCIFCYILNSFRYYCICCCCRLIFSVIYIPFNKLFTKWLLEIRWSSSSKHEHLITENIFANIMLSLLLFPFVTHYTISSSSLSIVYVCVCVCKYTMFLERQLKIALNFFLLNCL